VSAPGRALLRTPYGLDAPMLGAAFALSAWGLVMVASASVAVAEKLTGAPLHFFFKQLLFALMGLACGAVVFAVPMAAWQKSGYLLLATALLLLVLVLIPGVGLEVNGARRWLDFGAFRLQASEPARLALLIYLAGYVVRRQVELQNSFLGLLKPLLPLCAAGALMMLEPDLGATAILLGVAFLMLFLGGARLLYLGLMICAGAGAFALLVATSAYRMRRLLAFADPWADVENSGWQLAQALIAIGRGEWSGVGLGNSVQKLLYLPETHTDFIFAVLAEEFGMLGIAALLALFGVLIWRGFAIARAAERFNQRFKAYLCYGLTAWLGLQALINMAVNMGLLPTKGLTLPLMSYGGSSLITVFVVLALILRIDHENRREAAGQPAGGFPSVSFDLKSHLPSWRTPKKKKTRREWPGQGQLDLGGGGL
jgi:cell division protein FtsW